MRRTQKGLLGAGRIIVALLLSLVFGSGVSGAQGQPKFTSRSALVLVPVQVKDGNGIPVLDLHQDDFALFDNGKPQRVFSFDPPVNTSLASPIHSQPSTEFANTDEEEVPRYLTIIALDAINTRAGDQVFAKRVALEFLSHPTAVSGPVAIVYFTRGGIKFIHHFSRNTTDLRRALQEAHLPPDLNFTVPIDTSNFPVTDPQARKVKELTEKVERDEQRFAEQTKAELTADSLRALAEVFANFAGQKTVLWITGGLRFRSETPVLGRGYTAAEEGRGIPGDDRWARAFRYLNNANVALYPVDARGLVAPGDLSDKSDVDIAIAKPGEKARLESQAHQEFLTTLTWVASKTGGKALFNSNDLSTVLERASRDAAASYLLTFRLPNDARIGWHRLEVKVRRPGTSVNTRPGFWVEHDHISGEDEINAALHSPFAQRGLPLMIRWTGSPDKAIPGKRVVNFQLAIPPGALTAGERDGARLNLEIFALALDPAQSVVGSFRRRIELDLDTESRAKLARSGFSYSAGMELPPGQYNVKFVVRDNSSGRFGGTLAPLELP